MASEDSDQLVPGFLAVHRFHDLRDLDESSRHQVSTFLHERHAHREFLEVSLFGRKHRVFAEERDDRVDQLRPPLDDVLREVLAMVVVPPVERDPSDPEEALKPLEASEALSRLASRRTDVRPDSRSCSLCDSFDVVAERTRWRSIPLRLQSRRPSHETRSVFPADFPHPTRCHHGKRPIGRYEVVRDTPGFPAYSQMRTAPLLVRGATNCLKRLLSLLATIP